MNRKQKNIAGFSLIEIILVIAVAGVVFLAISTFQRDVIVHNSMIQSGAIAEEGLRNTLRQFVGELRAAAPAENGAYAMEAVSTSSVTFYSDVDSDDSTEKIRYFLSGKSFKKGVTEPTGQPAVYNSVSEQLRLVADDVINGTTSIFSFYGSNYTGTSSALTEPIDISQIRLIKINLGLDPNPNRPLEAMWVTSQVMMRNLRNSD